jgi:hypothetical protein
VPSASRPQEGVGRSQGPGRQFPATTQAPSLAKRNTKRLRERGRRIRMEGAHHINEVVIRMHWQVGVEDGVRRNTPDQASPSQARSLRGAHLAPSRPSGVPATSAAAPVSRGTW